MAKDYNVKLTKRSKTVVRDQAIESRTVVKRPHDMVLERTRMLDELDGRARQPSLHRSNSVVLTWHLQQRLCQPSLRFGSNPWLQRDTVESGEAIRDAKQVQPGDLLRTRLHQGEVWSRVDHDADESR